MPSPPEVTRRQAAGVATAVVVGGVVLDSIRWSEIEETYYRYFPSARLGRLVVANRDSSSHKFHTTIGISGTKQYERTHEIAGESSVRIEDDLPKTQGRITVRTALTDLSDSETSESSTFSQDTCYGVGVNYAPRHGLWFTSGAPVEGCASEQ